METGKIALGVLGGLAAGALLGILFAPEKGSVTRKNISKASEDYLENIKEKFDEFLESASEKLSDAKDYVTKHGDHS
jgi:gas vesicle protein